MKAIKRSSRGGTLWGHHVYQDWRECRRRFLFSHVLKYESPAGAKALTLGTAWHEWRAVFVEAGSAAKADKAAAQRVDQDAAQYTLIADATIRSDIAEQLMRWSAEFPRWDTAWQKRHGKLVYLLPCEQERACTVGASAAPYTTRQDAVVTWQGTMWPLEVKSSGFTWDVLLEIHLLGGQISGYVYERQQAGAPCAGAILEHARSHVKDPEKLFNRKPILRPAHMVDRWARRIERDYAEIDATAKRAAHSTALERTTALDQCYDMDHNSCRTPMHTCPFRDVCLTPTLKTGLEVLEAQYRRKG